MNRSILCVCALSCAICLAGHAHAGNISLSLNLEFSTQGDLTSGGIWTAVAKAEERGIAGLKMSFVDATLNFDPNTGFLTPAGFEVEASSVFGSRLEIVQGDDLTDPTLDVGVIGGTYPSTYVDDPGLVVLGANPDLGSFTGGVALATGTFDPGDVPEWVVGADQSNGNLFVDAAGTVQAADNVFWTVRHVVPEPGMLSLLVLGSLAVVRRKQ